MSFLNNLSLNAVKENLAPLLLTVALFISLNTQGGGRHLLADIAALILSLILIVSYYWGHFNKPALLPRNRGVYFYFTFVVWAGFSVLWSAAQAPSLLALLPFIGGILAIFIGYTYSAEQAKTQMQLLLLLAVFLSFYTIYQAIILNINRPAGFMVDWNTHGAFLTMLLLPVCGQFLIQQQLHRNSLHLGVCCSLLFLAISLTLSRGAFLSLFIGLLLISTLALRNTMLVISILKLLAWLVFGYVLAEVLNQHESFSSRFNAVAHADNLEDLGSNRHLIWMPAWKMFLDRPILGWGLNTFHLLFHQYKAPLTIEAGYFVHNDYLQFLLELGPIGLVLFLGFVFSLIFYGVTLLKQNNEGVFSSTHFYTFTLLSACIAMLVHTAFNFNLYHFPIQILLGLYVGRTLIYLYADKTAFVPAKIMTAKRYYSILAGFSLPVFLFLGALLFALVNVNSVQNAKDSTDKLDFAWKAQLFLPFLDIFDYQRTIQLTSLLKTGKVQSKDKQPLSQMGMDLIDTAIYKYALNPLNYVAKAELLIATDSPAINSNQIKRNYQQALTLAPDSLEIRDNFAVYLSQHQQSEQALAILQDAWERYYVNAYQNGVVLLKHQLQLNQHFGKAEDNPKIEHEINRLLELQKTNEGGGFVFEKYQFEQL